MTYGIYQFNDWQIRYDKSSFLFKKGAEIITNDVHEYFLLRASMNKYFNSTPGQSGLDMTIVYPNRPMYLTVCYRDFNRFKNFLYSVDRHIYALCSCEPYRCMGIENDSTRNVEWLNTFNLN